MELKKVHSDERGEIYIITSLLPDNKEVTILTTNKGFARGGCIHHLNDERFVVIKGMVRYFVEGRLSSFYNKGTSGFIGRGKAHYLIAITDSVVMEWGATVEEKKEKHKEWRKIVNNINREKIDESCINNSSV